MTERLSTLIREWFTLSHRAYLSLCTHLSWFFSWPDLSRISPPSLIAYSTTLHSMWAWRNCLGALLLAKVGHETLVKQWESLSLRNLWLVQGCALDSSGADQRPFLRYAEGFPQAIKCLPTMQEICVQSLGQEDLLEKEMAAHSSILDWKIPWMEEPGGLQSMGSQRVRHGWATSLSLSLSRLCSLWTVEMFAWSSQRQDLCLIKQA